MLRKKEVYTIITPIPGFIPRQLAIDILHSHGEVITLNPLVLSHKQIQAPRDAAADEYFSTWYEITERVQFVPGMGRFGSGKISFNACFHDLSWGIQTHVYAPLNIDMRNKYRICGNQPGVEQPEPAEIGLAELGAPKDGLYLREDIEIRCNITMIGTVKAQMKAASKDMVQRIIKKAELLDAGVLQAMIEDGKMKTFNPRDRPYTGGLQNPSRSQQPSPVDYFGQASPKFPSIPYQVPRPASTRPGTASSSLGYPSHWQSQTPQPQQMTESNNKAIQAHNELASDTARTGQSFVMELPGDYYYPQSSPGLPPAQSSPTSQYSRSSTTPDQAGQRSWSQQPSPSLNSSRPSSYTSDPGSMHRASPGLEQRGFASELTTHRETPEEHSWAGRLGNNRHPSHRYPYNPADYDRVNR